MGPNAIGFMGAPADVVQGARDGTASYYVMMLALVGLLSGLAYLSWKKQKGLFTRLILWFFTGIFTLRGLLFVFFIPPLLNGNLGADPTKFWFHFLASIFVLSIGLSLGLGLWRTRNNPDRTN